jgi:hypothetical protein
MQCPKDQNQKIFGLFYMLNKPVKQYFFDRSKHYISNFAILIDLSIFNLDKTNKPVIFSIFTGLINLLY